MNNLKQFNVRLSHPLGQLGEISSLLTLLLLIVAALVTTPLHAASAGWQKTIDKVSSGVVAIRVDHVRAYDEKWNQSTDATGFVVDKKRGIILTNRHVVGSGPATAQAVFLNQEEVDLKPIYRDPVHDFGFFQYNPEDLEFIEPVELKLNPDGAEVGMEIRVVGNDAGEQLSVLDGTISRLDRPAPGYGVGRYNDFNTYYLQAASSTSGGSSGSPVFNRRGDVIALNAGARSKAATSFFLPLHQAEKALAHLQRSEPVPRGTLETTFAAKPYADLEKLGLTRDAERRARRQNPDGRGLLVIDHILPDNQDLEVGDILLKAASRPIWNFLNLANILDANVGKTIELELERAGEPLTVSVPVKDLHHITPSRYLEIDGAVMHDLSYQQARHYNRPVEGVYLADPGFSFSQSGLQKGTLITQVNDKRVKNIDELASVLATAAGSGKEIDIRYITQSNVAVERVARARLDLKWFPSQICAPAVETVGTWDCEPLNLEAAALVQEGTIQINQTLPPVERSLVYVTFRKPYPISAQPAGKRSGTGIVVDEAEGLVLTSRTIVPSNLGNAQLTFAGTIEVDAKVLHIHPTHNLVILKYDPDAVRGIGVSAARFADDAKPQVGETYRIVGLDNEQKIRRQPSVYGGVEAFHFPTSSPPQFQNVNTELMKFVNGPANFTGVITNDQDEVIALWQRYSVVANKRTQNWYRGTHLDVAMEFLNAARANRPWFDLGTGLYPMPLAQAHKAGLPTAIVSALHSSGGRAYEVHRLTHGTDASEKLRLGDVIVSVEDEFITGLHELQGTYQQNSVKLRILRDREMLDITLEKDVLPTQGLTQIALWGGALIQPIPRTLAQERALPQRGVYVSYYRFGSPASRAGLSANLRITHVDDDEVSDMDSFIAAISTKADGQTVRLTTRTLRDQTKVVTLRVDNTYWPGYEFELAGTTWQRRAIGS